MWEYHMGIGAQIKRENPKFAGLRWVGTIHNFHNKCEFLQGLWSPEEGSSQNGETYKKALHNPKNQPSLHKFLSGNSSDSDGDEPDELDEIEPSTEATEANQHCDMADSDDEDMYAPVKCHARCKYSVQQQRHIDYVKKSIDDAGKCAFVLWDASAVGLQ